MAITVNNSGAAAWQGPHTADFTYTLDTHAAGDRLYLFATWKDFGIGVTVSGWTEDFEQADGTTVTGNGTGSMKVGVWHKDATSSSETNPLIDFSTTTGLLGTSVLYVLRKPAGESWKAPVIVKKAMTTWTTSSQTEAADATATVPNNAIVIGIAGIRDDSATFTRPTTGIDASSGITWSADYVELPITHQSTTTGNDLAADAGYRIVGTSGGGSGITLRQTATLSAAETGMLAWIIQGTETLVSGASPTALALTTFAPTVTAGTSNVTVTPTTATLTTATFAPTISHTIMGASPTALTTASFAPTIAHKIVGALPTALAISTFAPTISVTDHKLVTPTTASASLATFAPTVTATDHKTVTPDVAAVSTATFAPTVTASDHQSVTPTTAALATASFAPTVTASDHKIVIPDVAALTTASFAPSINIGVNVTPAAGILALATFAPVATWTDNQLVTPDAAVLSLSAFAPGVATPQTFTPSTAALILAAFAPKAIEGGPITSIDSDLDAGPIVDGELDAGPSISGSVGAVRIRARLVVSPPPASGDIDVD